MTLPPRRVLDAGDGDAELVGSFDNRRRLPGSMTMSIVPGSGLCPRAPAVLRLGLGRLRCHA